MYVFAHACLLINAEKVAIDIVFGVEMLILKAGCINLLLGDWNISAGYIQCVVA